MHWAVRLFLYYGGSGILLISGGKWRVSGGVQVVMFSLVSIFLLL